MEDFSSLGALSLNIPHLSAFCLSNPGTTLYPLAEVAIAIQHYMLFSKLENLNFVVSYFSIFMLQ